MPGGWAMTARRWVLGLLAVLVLAALIFALPAGRRPFWSSDEARFALLAQDILENGRWLVPRLRAQQEVQGPRHEGRHHHVGEHGVAEGEERRRGDQDERGEQAFRPLAEGGCPLVRK